MQDNMQKLGIKLAKNPFKDVLIASQNVQDAINASRGPSSANAFATIADIDGTGAAITPATIAASDTTDSTSSTTGAVTTAGGLGVAKAINAGTTITAGSGVVTDSITEKTAGKGITLSKNIVRKSTLAALNSTGTITAAMVNNGGITSTSAAGVTATLDSVANIVAQTGATAGTMIDFIVDNTAGASTVTVAVPAGIVAAKQVSSGDTAVDVLLTVAASATVGVGLFRLYFQSTSAAVLFRIG